MKRISLLLMAALLIAGCGYSHQALYPKGIRTVAVPIFKNRSFYQGAEFDLTEAIIKEIERRTPYKVAAPAGADTVLEGTITAIEQIRLSRRAEGGVPQEMELRIVVNLEWKNQRTGQILRDRKGLEAVGRYIPTRLSSPSTQPASQPASGSMGETYFTGQHEAAQRLADKVVDAMRDDW